MYVIVDKDKLDRSNFILMNIELRVNLLKLFWIPHSFGDLNCSHSQIVPTTFESRKIHGASLSPPYALKHFNNCDFHSLNYTLSKLLELI